MKLHRDIGVSQPTAWFMLHRTREGWKRSDESKQFSGPVEIDETYMGGRRRNMSNVRRNLQAIAVDVQGYHDDLCRRFQPAPSRARGGCQPERIVLRYLDRYGDGLTGHPVALDEAGRALQVVERINYVIEQFFGIAKQGLQRRVGRAHLGRDLDDRPAEVALTANLRHADYVRIL